MKMNRFLVVSLVLPLLLVFVACGRPSATTLTSTAASRITMAPASTTKPTPSPIPTPTYGDASSKILVPSSEVDKFKAEQKAMKPTVLPTPTAATELKPGTADLLRVAFERANNDQKRDLNALANDKSVPSFLQQTKKILIIMGALPKDIPILTIEEAKAICNDPQAQSVKSILDKFNLIAGAPDVEGGSGFDRIIYYSNQDRTEGIRVVFNAIYHFPKNEDGSLNSLIIYGK